jgi:hypothetical protein
MKRIRRISIELIRREFDLSVSWPVVAARPQSRSAQDGRERQESPPPPAECPVCASPWFALSLGDGEESPMVQRALAKHGIHTQRSSASELLVCRSSFELQTGAIDVTSHITQEPQLQRNDPSTRGTGDSNV